MYSLHCQQHARAAGCARPPAHTHTHRHTYRHTHRSGWGERQRETARASEKARDTPARAAPRRPLRPGSSPAPPAARPRAPVPVIYAAAASAGCGFLRPPPPGRAPHSRQQLPGLARGCVVWGLLPRRRGCHLPGRCPGVPGRGKFLRLHSGALHLRTPPRPSHLHAGPGCDFTLPRAPPAAAAAKFRPSRSARCGGAGVTCVKFRLSVGVAFRTLHHHLLFFFILHCDGGRENRQKGDCRWLTYDF